MYLEQLQIRPKWANGQSVTFHHRIGSSDEDVIKEVIDRRCYRRPSIGFSISPKEHWLDLGANMGTFAAYCYLSGATATCYEPDRDCYSLLCRNVAKMGKGFNLINSAVTTSKERTLPALKSNNPDNHYRLTFQIHDSPTRYVDAGKLPNIHVSKVLHSSHSAMWDGVKMDIEGSELAMIDSGLLPQTNKMVMEYHFSRDNKSMPNFHRRMKKLRKMYEIVKYPPSLDRVEGDKYPGRFDIFVFCKDYKYG